MSRCGSRIRGRAFRPLNSNAFSNASTGCRGNWRRGSRGQVWVCTLCARWCGGTGDRRGLRAKAPGGAARLFCSFRRRRAARCDSRGPGMTRILVVEDEQHLADGLRFNLEAQGYEVQIAETGEAALELLASKDAAFDVVVLDVMLPGIDGFAVISSMRQAGQFVPTLMLTARGQPQDVLRGFAAGADDYLPKPFDLAILMARIKSLLRRREWVRATAQTPAADPDT